MMPIARALMLAWNINYVLVFFVVVLALFPSISLHFFKRKEDSITIVIGFLLYLFQLIEKLHSKRMHMVNYYYDSNKTDKH